MIDYTDAVKLSEDIISNVMKHEIAFEKNLITDFDYGRNRLLGRVIWKLWDQLLSKSNAYGNERPLTLSEKAMACLIRKGVDKNSININGTTTYFPLGNLTYRIEKEGAGFSACPCVSRGASYSEPLRWITLPGEEFAEFVFDFDSIAGAAISKVDGHLLEAKALAMQYSIICQTIDFLGEQFLKPDGISWTVGTSFTDTSVSLSFSKEGLVGFTESIDLDQLADVIAGIPERMQKQPARKKQENRFAWWDDDLL